jgi:hypothetical protein
MSESAAASAERGLLTELPHTKSRSETYEEEVMSNCKKVRPTTPESYLAYLAYREYIVARGYIYSPNCALERSMAAFAIEQTPENEAAVDSAKRRLRAQIDEFNTTKAAAKDAFQRAGMTNWSAATANFRQWDQAIRFESRLHPDAVRAGKLAAVAVRAAGGAEDDAQAAGRAAYHKERAKEGVQ